MTENSKENLGHRVGIQQNLEEVTLLEKGASKPELAWYRMQSSNGLDDLRSPFRFKWQFFRKLWDTFFIIENRAMNWSGYSPNFEESILFDKCKSCTFSFSRLFWERKFKETRPLNSSIRSKRLNIN